MKKILLISSIIFVVAAIAVLSVFAILSFRKDSDDEITKEDSNEFLPVVYQEKIEILNSDLRRSDSHGNFAVIRPDENGALRYQIEYKVSPDDATNKSVTFAYDTSLKNVTVSDTGLVEFTSQGIVRITIVANDGSNTSETITVIAKAN